MMMMALVLLIEEQRVEQRTITKRFLDRFKEKLQCTSKRKKNWGQFEKFVEVNASDADKAYLSELLAIVDKDIANTEANRYFGGSTPLILLLPDT